MPVDTAKVADRRKLQFNSLDDILAEVDRLGATRLRTLGNWTPGQILMHLSIPIVWCLDGAPVRAPWFIRLFGWFVKNRFVKNPMPAGFQLPRSSAEHLIPADTSWEDGVAALKKAIERLKTEPQRHPSPFLGVLTPEQWIQLHCRHAELHLSFLVPEPA